MFYIFKARREIYLYSFFYIESFCIRDTCSFLKICLGSLQAAMIIYKQNGRVALRSSLGP